MLVPQPGAKPEFLATLQVVDPSPVVTKIWMSPELPIELVLDGYTRDGWAWKPNTTAFQSLIVESIDGRNKLPGFVSYLQQRQKASYGRFGSKGIWVISYVQQKQQQQQQDNNNKNRIECRLSLDVTQIPDCNLKPRAASVVPQKQQQQQPVRPIVSQTVRKKGGGLLGKLVGAQKRTNQHVMEASMGVVDKNSQYAATTSTRTVNVNSDDSAIAEAESGEASVAATATAIAAGGGGTKTSMQIMNEFRQAMESKMLDFDIAPDQELRVPLSLSEYTAQLTQEEDKSKVTMEILKYMVYEAAEEVNEEWIAHKEPSEFMDEAVICIYKEGAAPSHVLEEINIGEMPEEVKGQQRAIQEERMKQMNQAEQKKANELLNQAHNWKNNTNNTNSNGGGGGGEDDENNNDDDDDGGMAALNQNKRDRRTVADYERDKQKRTKPSLS